MSTEMDVLTEVKERVVRLESRLVQLGDYVGANLRSKMRIDIASKGEKWVVMIDALDVSISRILSELRDANVRGAVDVMLSDGRVVATVHAR